MFQQKINKDTGERTVNLRQFFLFAFLCKKIIILTITSHIFPTRHKNITVIKPWNH